MENFERKIPPISEPPETPEDAESSTKVSRRMFLNATGAALAAGVLGGEKLAQADEKYTSLDYRQVEAILTEREDIPPGITQYISRFFQKNNTAMEFIETSGSSQEAQDILREETLSQYDNFSFHVNRITVVGQPGQNFYRHQNETLENLKAVPAPALLARLNQWASEHEIDTAARDLDRGIMVNFARLANKQGSWEDAERELRQSITKTEEMLENPSACRKLTTAMQKKLFESEFRMKPSNNITWFTEHLTSRLEKAVSSNKKALERVLDQRKK